MSVPQLVFEGCAVATVDPYGQKLKCANRREAL